MKKYLLLIFLIENIAAQTAMGWLSDYLFYPFMALGLFYMLNSSFWSSENIEKFKPLYLLSAVYVLYAFTIGFEYLNQKNILYLLAKLSTFSMIIVSLGADQKFYEHKGVWILAIVMSGFLCYGLLSGGEVQSSGRALAGFTNENTAGAMGALTVGFLLFYMRGRKWSWLPVVIVIAGIYGVLAGASRSGFLMLGLFIFLRYGINLKTAGLVILVVVAGLYILPAIGVNTIGIQRMIDTYEGIERTNRGLEREAAEWMIAQKPLTGWGFNVKNIGYAASLSLLASHNGYLELAKQMGVPFEVVYFMVILAAIIVYWKVKRQNKLPMDLFFAMIFVLLVKANYESSFIGVHEYGTNIFFIALAVVSSRTYEYKHLR